MKRTIVHSIRVLVLVALGPCVSTSLGAQEVQPSRAQPGGVGSVIAYEGGTIDAEVSFDSRLFDNRARVRTSIGHGRWVDANERLQGVRMTRVSITALFFNRPRPAESVRSYGGVGYARFLPHGSVAGPYHGVHLVGGIEGRVREWVVGPELAFELGLPDRRPWSNEHPMMCGTARFGIAIRRRF